MAVIRRLGGAHGQTPRQPQLDSVDLNERFLGNRQRLNQHSHVAQCAWYRIHVYVLVDHKVRHESVHLLDAALTKITRVAEILAACAASYAIRMGAWTPHHRYSKISGFETRYAR